MATFPARTEISDTGSNPTNAVARVGFGRLWDWVNEVLGMWIVAGGTADAITATYSPAVVLVDGLVCNVRATAANTITTPTFSPNGLTARTITMTGGNALAVGSISGANHELKLKYYAASTRWELLNPAVTATTLGAALRAGTNFTGGVNTGKTTYNTNTATPDLFATTVNNVIDYTNTTTVTGFAAAPQAGITRTLICAGTATFTVGANLLVDGLISGNLVTTAGDILVITAVTTTQFRITGANVVKKDVANVFTAQQTPFKAAATASAGASYNWSLSAGQVLHLTFGAGNITSLTVTNGVASTFYTLYLKQDGVGGRLISSYTGFKFANGALPTLSSSANAVDIFTFYYDGTSMNCIGQAAGLA